jgi:hypothetical protein
MSEVWEEDVYGIVEDADIGVEEWTSLAKVRRVVAYLQADGKPIVKIVHRSTIHRVEDVTIDELMDL